MWEKLKIADSANKQSALDWTKNEIYTDGSTAFKDALATAIDQFNNLSCGKNMIIALTDGQPDSDPSELIKIISELNINKGISIYSLGFGDGVGIDFLNELSAKNYGYAVKIYESSDSKSQLDAF